MLRGHLTHDLETLRYDIIEMANLVIDAIKQISYMVETKDPSLSIPILEGESQLLHYDASIEQRAMRLLLTQQPVAKDLRNVTAALKIGRDYYRMYTISVEWAKLYKDCQEGEVLKEIPYFEDMVKILVQMSEECLEAFKVLSRPMTEHTIETDVILDNLFVKFKYAMIDRLKEETIDPHFAVNVLLMGKYFEKLGDHIESIGNHIMYIITGTLREDTYSNNV